MITAAQQNDWFLHHLSQSAGDLPGRGLVWLNTHRKRARQSLPQLPALNREQEAWRYTSIEGLLQQRFIPASTDIGAFKTLDINPWLLSGLDAYRLVFVNGRCLPLPADLLFELRHALIESIEFFHHLSHRDHIILNRIRLEL